MSNAVLIIPTVSHEVVIHRQVLDVVLVCGGPPVIAGALVLRPFDLSHPDQLHPDLSV